LALLDLPERLSPKNDSGITGFYGYFALGIGIRFPIG